MYCAMSISRYLSPNDPTNNWMGIESREHWGWGVWGQLTCTTRGRNGTISDGYESGLLQVALARTNMQARREVLAMTDIVSPEQHTCYEQVLTISPYPLLGPSSSSSSPRLNQTDKWMVHQQTISHQQQEQLTYPDEFANTALVLCFGKSKWKGDWQRGLHGI